MILLQAVREKDSMEISVEFFRVAVVPGLLVFIDHNRMLRIEFSSAVYPHPAVTTGRPSVPQHLNTGLITLIDVMLQKLCPQPLIQWFQILICALY